MLDPETGRVEAVVEAASANALRTAAADALAVETLARTDARTLSILGAGHQAYYDAMAVTAVRSFTQLLIAARLREAAERLADRLARDTGIASRAVDVEEACRRADVLITATSSTEPLFDADWIGAGTHISAMGADGPGKQEVPVEIYERARLFCDISTQSRSIGEFQHAPASTPDIELGLVLHGHQAGRTAEDEITIFDSSGFALQDLTLAKALLAAAGEQGDAQ